MMATTTQNNVMRSCTLNKKIVIIQAKKDKTRFILPNSYVFELQNSDFTIGEEEIEFRIPESRNYDEIFGRISTKDIFSKTANFKGYHMMKTRTYAKKEQRSTAYSDHTDFQPDKRVIFFPIKVLQEYIDDPENFGFGSETQGTIRIVKNFVFVPLNGIAARFSKNIYTGKHIDVTLYNRVKASVSNQTMTAEQTASMASILTTLQMGQLQLCQKYEVYLATFGLFFENNVFEITKGKNVKFSKSDVWKALSERQTNLIPVHSVPFRKRDARAFMVETALSKVEEEFQIIYTEDCFKKMAEKHICKVEQSEMTIDELAEYYKSGMMHVFSENGTFKFYNSEVRTNRIGVATEERNDAYRMLKFLVEDRFKEVDLGKTLFRLADFLLTCEESFARKIFQKLAKINVGCFYHPGLNKLFVQEVGQVPSPPTLNYDKLKYVAEHMQLERSLCKLAQSEVTAWSKVFNLPHMNIFDDVDYMIDLGLSRRLIIETVVRTDEEEDEPTYSKKILNAVKAPFKAGGAFIKNVQTLVEKGASFDPEAMYQRAKNDLAAEFQKVGMENVTTSLISMKFDSIANSISTVKNLIAAWFSDVATKICSLFGVSYKNMIDPTQLLFYYLVWTKNDSVVLKYYIILDILGSLGILDFFLTVLKKVYSAIKNMFIEPAGEFEEFISQYENRTKRVEQQISEKISELPEVDFSEEKTGWLTKIMKEFSNATPTLLGVAATAMLAGLGYKCAKESKKSIGEQVILGARNISFLALGMGAIPKIFENIMKVFYWVVDKVKSVTIKEHSSAVARIKRVEDWLSKTIIIEGVTQNLIVNDLATCFKFLDAQIELAEIEKFIHAVEDPTIRIFFKQRKDKFESLIGLVHSAIRMLLLQREVFHVQLYSPVAGVGKTDLAGQVLDEMKHSISMEESLIERKFGIIKAPSSEGTYPMNDLLNHADNYYGQAYGYSDEENVFKKVEPDVIISKMILYSGYPTISQQASLNSKGRIYSFKGVCSNTNNAFLPPEGMMRPEAIWRRRHLFKVDVKPEYLTDNKIDPLKISGTARTRGEHLMITYLDPTNDQEVPIDSGAQDMTVPQFLRLVGVLAKKHVADEENRLLVKTGGMSLVRMRYAEMQGQLDQRAGEFGEGETLSFIGKTITDLRKLAKDMRDARVDKPSNPEEILKTFRADSTVPLVEQEINDLESIKSVLESEDEGAEIARAYLNELTSEVGFADFDEETSEFTLNYDDTGKYYSLVPGFGRMASGSLKQKEFCIRDVFGKSRITFSAPNKVSREEEKIILWHLVDYSSCRDESEFEKYKREKIKQIRILEKVKTWKQKIAGAYEKMKHILNTVARFVNRHIVQRIGEVVVIGLSAALGIFITFFTLNVVGQMLSPTPENVSYNQRQDKHQIVRIPNPSPISAIHEESMHKVAMKATYRIYYIGVKEEKQINVSGTIVGLKGSLYLANKHTVQYLTRNTTVSVYDHIRGVVNIKDGISKTDVSPHDIIEIPNCDAVVINLRHLRSCRSVLNHFVTELDCVRNLENFRMASLSAVLLNDSRTPTSDLNYNDSERSFHHTGLHQGMLCDYNNTNVQFRHDRVFEFFTDDGVNHGNSGSLVIHDETKLSGRFIGILLAKRSFSKGAYCGVITKEVLERAIEKFDFQSRIVTTVCETTELPDSHPLKEVFELKDDLYVSPFKTQAVSRSSGFRPSKIFGAFEVETQPAIQDHRDPRIPPDARHFMKVSLNKTNGANMPYFNQEEERFMIAGLIQTYQAFVPNLSKVKVYGTKQAITGIRMKGSTSINTKTCAGLPYKTEKGVVGKSPFIRFDAISNTWQISERTYAEVELYKSYYNQGLVPRNYKLEFRKKELVGPNKIMEPKTRTVATGNFVHQILYNECFKDFMTFVKNVWDNKGTMPFALGVDPERHWHQVAEHLEFHDYVMDFDVKAWESKVSLQHLLMTTTARLHIINKAYQSRGEKMPDISKIAYCLAVDYTDADVVFEDVMYHKQAGLLSGHPGTFIENSEIHVMTILLICRRILQRVAPQWATVSFILTHVRFILAADDVVIAVSKLVRRYINVETIVQGYTDLGFELTAPDKSLSLQATTLEKCQFLKNHFRQENGIFHPVPNLSIINQLFNWVRDDSALTPDDQFAVNMQNAFRFAWWRGEEEYERIRSTANDALFKFNLNWPYTYEEMRVYVNIEINKNIERAERENPIGIIEDPVFNC